VGTQSQSKHCINPRAQFRDFDLERLVAKTAIVAFESPCFKSKDPSKLYFIIGKDLYVSGSSPDSVRDLRITLVKTLPHCMPCTNLTCYFFNGDVFFRNYAGVPVVRTIGEI
jgi:hypothetical protein